MIKKIVFFTTHFDYPRQRYLEYYEKILPKNVECFLMCQEGEEKKFSLKKIKKQTYPNKFLSFIPLRKFCKENEIDLVINLSGSSALSLTFTFATFLTKTKTIFYFFGDPEIKLGNSPFLLTQFFTNRFLVSSSELTNKLKKYLNFNKNKIFHLPLTVDTTLYNPKDKNKARNKLKFKKNEKIIVFCGRISNAKGSDLLLKLIKNNPDKRFLLIGQILDENYKNNNLKNIIHVPHANFNELVDYYCASDLCVFLSKIEGFGLTPREAMACGVPTIVSNIPALKTIEAAIKVNLDAEDAQKAVDSFFNLSREKQKEMAKNSRKFIINECSQEKMKKNYLKYFLQFKP